MSTDENPVSEDVEEPAPMEVKIIKEPEKEKEETDDPDYWEYKATKEDIEDIEVDQ